MNSLNTFEVSLWVDGDLVKQVVDNVPDAREAEFAALRLVMDRLLDAVLVDVAPYLTVYMGPTAEQTLLMGVEE